ncbi:MAG: cell division topological specificity factor MinE [Clostridia bacterium]|nr:cell division topological specificity factor MinE [Clostridia bacterium]
MRMFFLNLKIKSKNVAKERLSTVIKSDRINLKESAIIEKMRKEISGVLSKYTDDTTPEVKILCAGGQCVLSAQMPFKE